MGYPKNKNHFIQRSMKGMILSLMVICLFAASSFATELGSITNFQEVSNYYEITCGSHKVRVMFYKDDIFRIWLGPNGSFTDPAGDASTPIVVYDGDPAKKTYSDEGTYHKIATSSCVLRINKSPCQFSLYQTDNSTLIFEEDKPIDFGNTTYQSIKRKSGEHFYGCGMKNGHFDHLGSSLNLQIFGGWQENDHPNIATFYMCTSGYGIFRNTFHNGTYNFTTSIDYTSCNHQENRFDAYYYVGSLKNVLNGHTLITGRPFMPSYWYLEFGDANDFHRGTYGRQAIDIADMFLDEDIPVGWFLPNDGYNLPWTEYDWAQLRTDLAQRGIYLGMWVNFSVGASYYSDGVQITKLDIGTLSGMTNSQNMNFNNEHQEMIRTYANGRGGSWMTGCWSGSQRYSIPWSGDNSTGWNWLRWHVPTVQAGTMSGFNGAGTGDVDAIFGDGTNGLYSRDLQWKCWTPYMMVIGGWSNRDYKEPFNSMGNTSFFTAAQVEANRKALKLRSRLNAYFYSLCYTAHTTGVGMARPMVLEFPEDKGTWDGVNNTYVKHQFMSGPYVLVAPVYEQSATSRDLYLPEGKWTNYWTGQRYQSGPDTISVSCANLALPLLVREGAILPMYNDIEVQNNKQIRRRDIVTFDIYPHSSEKTSFTLYEDDWETMKFETNNEFSLQHVQCKQEGGATKVWVSVGKADGNYDGKLSERINKFIINRENKDATKVNLAIGTGNPVQLTEKNSITEVDNALSGWYYSDEKGGFYYIKTDDISLNEGFVVSLGEHPTGVISIDNINIDKLRSSSVISRNGKVHLQFASHFSGKVNITIYNIQGQIVRKIPVTIQNSNNVLVWDNSNNSGSYAANGCYILRLTYAGKAITKNFILQK